MERLLGFKSISSSAFSFKTYYSLLNYFSRALSIFCADRLVVEFRLRDVINFERGVDLVFEYLELDLCKIIDKYPQDLNPYVIKVGEIFLKLHLAHISITYTVFWS